MRGSEAHPGRDARAVRISPAGGANRVDRPRSVVVIGGGIAGLAAATGLAERGVQVHLVEREEELGGRVRSWNADLGAGPVTMSRGFHAFFRQYYNLRALLGRAGDLDGMLRPVEDYPVISGSGDRDSFTSIPRTPPLNFMTFVAKSPTFRLRDLRRVDLDSALSLLDVSFPETFRELEHESAEQFLDGGIGAGDDDFRAGFLLRGHQPLDHPRAGGVETLGARQVDLKPPDAARRIKLAHLGVDMADGARRPDAAQPARKRVVAAIDIDARGVVVACVLLRGRQHVSRHSG